MANLKKVVKALTQAERQLTDTKEAFENAGPSGQESAKKTIEQAQYDFEEAEKQLISTIQELCPKLIEDLRLAIVDFLADPTNEVKIASIKEQILIADQQFRAAYPPGSVIGAEEVDYSFLIIFSQIIEYIGRDKLKISPIQFLANLAKQEDFLVTNSASSQSSKHRCLSVRFATLKKCVQEIYPFSPYAEKIKHQLWEDIFVFSCRYNGLVVLMPERLAIYTKPPFFNQFFMAADPNADNVGGLIYTVCDAQKNAYWWQKISKEELVNKLEQEYAEFYQALKAGETGKVQLFLSQILEITLERGHSRRIFQGDQKRKLESLEEEVEGFFGNRLFYSEKETELLIERIKKINQELGLSLNSEALRRVKDEFLLKEVIDAVKEFATSCTGSAVAEKAGELLERVSSLCRETFDTEDDFSPDNKANFFQNLSQLIEKDKRALAKYPGWEKVVEKITNLEISFSDSFSKIAKVIVEAKQRLRNEDLKEDKRQGADKQIVEQKEVLKQLVETAKWKLVFLIGKICPELIGHLRSAVKNFLADPTNEGVIAALKTEILTATGYLISEGVVGHEALSYSFDVIFNEVSKKLTGKLKISDIQLLAKLVEEENFYLENTQGLSQGDHYKIHRGLAVLQTHFADVYPLSVYKEKTIGQLVNDIHIFTSSYNLCIYSFDELSEGKESPSIFNFFMASDEKGGVIYRVYDAAKKTQLYSEISKEKFVDQLGQEGYQKFYRDLQAFNKKNLPFNERNSLKASIESFFPQILQITLEKEHTRRILSNDQQEKLKKLGHDVGAFFLNRSFCNKEETKFLISKIKRVNHSFGLSLNAKAIRHAREEFCLQEAIDAIEKHAKSYRVAYPKDAKRAEKLAKDLSQLTSNFFAAGHFSREKKKEFLQELCDRIQPDQRVLAKHRGWGEVIENIALVASSLLVIGLLPALFKIYMRTAGGNKYFAYFQPKTCELVSKVMNIAFHVKHEKPSVPRLSPSPSSSSD